MWRWHLRAWGAISSSTSALSGQNTVFCYHWSQQPAKGREAAATIKGADLVAKLGSQTRELSGTLAEVEMEEEIKKWKEAKHETRTCGIRNLSVASSANPKRISVAYLIGIPRSFSGPTSSPATAGKFLKLCTHPRCTVDRWPRQASAKSKARTRKQPETLGKPWDGTCLPVRVSAAENSDVVLLIVADVGTCIYIYIQSDFF